MTPSLAGLPDVSGMPHPAAWPFYRHRRFGQMVVRRRFAVIGHGAEHVPAEGPVVFAANHIGVARTLTGRALPGPLPPGQPAGAVADPSTGVTPVAHPGGTP